MTIQNRFCRGMAAFVLATVAAVLSGLFGVVVTIRLVEWIIGYHALHGAPGHGSVVLLLAIPVGCLVALFMLVRATSAAYVRMSPR